MPNIFLCLHAWTCRKVSGGCPSSFLHKLLSTPLFLHDNKSHFFPYRAPDIKTYVRTYLYQTPSCVGWSSSSRLNLATWGVISKMLFHGRYLHDFLGRISPNGRSSSIVQEWDYYLELYLASPINAQQTRFLFPSYVFSEQFNIYRALSV